jgi:hypothetical protein
MTTPGQFKEYIWLVNTIYKARKISLKDINEQWLQTEMSEGVEINRTTFYRHRCAIEDIFGVYIDCDRKAGNKYFIGNREVLHEDSVQNWMLTTLSVSNLLSESMSLNDRILLESVPSGGGMLETVIKAMKESRKLSFSYQKYGKQQPDADREVSPYCVKLFRQRWYVLGPIANGEMRLFSLDRMGDVTLQKEKFKMDKNFDAIAYFSESYGVMVDHRVNTERIVLRAYGLEPYYLRDLPLHHSQREIRTTDEYCDFELRLKPTSDFKGKLLQRAEWIEVLEPQSLIDDIIALHQRSINRYKNYTNSGSKT